MFVLWRFIAVLVLVGLGVDQSWAEGGAEEEILEGGGVRFGVQRGSQQQLTAGARIEDGEEVIKEHLLRPQRKRRSRDSDDDGGADSPLWQWLTGRDQPNRCVMVSVGGVIGGGALTGAFVGAGIGSIFTGPGTVVGALVGGVVGMFGGISFGHRAGAAACDTSCGNSRCY
ncbi:hypothetical protein pipiens_014453 [Culex pipiens pipiens]|uniref:Glycine zipper domain-containing protein n=1 Tax=Culex pipiens pipiens TaxID=38569 RepID=A0ABD1CVN3_CULPP